MDDSTTTETSAGLAGTSDVSGPLLQSVHTKNPGLSQWLASAGVPEDPPPAETSSRDDPGPREIVLAFGAIAIVSALVALGVSLL